MNFDKFTIQTQEALNKASQLAVSDQQQIIQTGHLLKAIFAQEANISTFLFKKLDVDKASFDRQLEQIISTYPKSSGQNPYLSNDAAKALQEADKFRSSMKDEFVTIEHVLLGLLKGTDKEAQLMRSAGFSEDLLIKAIKELRGNHRVTDQNAESKYKSLERYSQNLTELAKKGKIDPVIGRDEEIRRVLQILSRRSKNNPMLIGEPGVGKTAIAEGLAQRIASGDVPENLRNITLVSLDMGLLVAGAKYKGEFEERLKSVIKEVTDSEGQIILFIDEIHTLVGAGGGEGAMDAANLLKPALARGELRSIGATTLKEYQKHIEKDKALERRFQTVMVNEPTVQDTISILRGIKEKYEVHHGVRIKDDAIIAAAELSNRYITDRFLPDKAIDLMDEAAARLRIQMNSLPEELDEVQRRIMQLEIEREAMRREKDKEKEKILSMEITDLQRNFNAEKSRWDAEKAKIEELSNTKKLIDQYRIQADQAERNGDLGLVAELRYGKIQDAEEKLKQLQADIQAEENPLIREEITAEEIADIVSRWTGIPVSRMLSSEREKLLHMEKELQKRVAGQAEAIEAISDAIRRSRAGLQDPRRPIGSFLFLGTTGVGKTELAKALAEFLFNDENAMVRIDMSEFQERHAVSRLIGAPPGYVGYDEGGQLTEAVRRKPYSVILLDEIEKAHPDVFNILLQVLDDGRLTDNKGRVADFKNTIVIMTTNTGSHLIQDRIAGMEEDLEKGIDERERILEDTRKEVIELLKATVRPEFLNRIDEILMFRPLSKEVIRDIVRIQFKDVQKRLAENDITLEADNDVLDYLGELGYDPQFGARPLKRVLQKVLLNDLSKAILKGEIEKDSAVGISLKIDDDGTKHLKFYNETPQ